MTSMPASRSARAMIFAPRSCPSSPGLATTTRILRVEVAASMEASSLGRRAPGSGDLLHDQLHRLVGRAVDRAVDPVRARARELPLVRAAALRARVELRGPAADGDGVHIVAGEPPRDRRALLDGDRRHATCAHEV